MFAHRSADTRKTQMLRDVCLGPEAFIPSSSLDPSRVVYEARRQDEPSCIPKWANSPSSEEEWTHIHLCQKGQNWSHQKLSLEPWVENKQQKNPEEGTSQKERWEIHPKSPTKAHNQGLESVILPGAGRWSPGLGSYTPPACGCEHSPLC